VLDVLGQTTESAVISPAKSVTPTASEMPCALAETPDCAAALADTDCTVSRVPSAGYANEAPGADAAGGAVTKAAPEEDWPGTATLTANAAARVVGAACVAPAAPTRSTHPRAAVVARWTSLTSVQGSRAAG